MLLFRNILLLIVFCFPCLGWAQAPYLPQKVKRNKLADVIPYFIEYAQQAMRAWQVPGMAIAIVKDDQVIYQQGFGTISHDSKQAVNAETIFQIGSISKSFTAALLAMQVNEGKLKWDDRVIKFLPNFALSDPWVTQNITVEDLLAQRTGLSPYALYYPVLLGASREDILRALKYVKLKYAFRSKFSYQNSLFIPAAFILEKNDQDVWENILAKRIFKPLGMQSSSTNLAGFSQPANVAKLHHKINGKVERIEDQWPYHHWAYTYAPAAGINSNVKDMAQWLILQLNAGKYKGKQLISKKNMLRMHKPVVIIDDDQNKILAYGLTWVHQQHHPFSLLWHGGQTTGSKSIIAMMPAEKLGIVILTNLRKTELPAALILRFFDQYFAQNPRHWSQHLQIKHNREQARKQAKLNHRLRKKNAKLASDVVVDINSLQGYYFSPVYGKVSVKNNNQQLELLFHRDGSTMYLIHHHGNIFRLYWPQVDEKAQSFVIFADIQANNGKLMFIEKFANDAGGKFKRLGVKPH